MDRSRSEHGKRIAGMATLLLALFVFAAPQFASAQTVQRGPYLQLGTPNSMIVQWRTNSSNVGVVRYGTSVGNLNQTATESGSATNHVVRINGLNPSTVYFYSIGTSAGPLAGGDSDHSFRTSPVAGSAEPTRIWVLGDSGTANNNARAVRNAYLNRTGSQRTDLLLMLGDNAYNDGTDSEYQRAVFNTYPTILRQTPVWPTLGNHDARSANSSNESGVYYNIFTLPRNAEAGGLASGTEAYYSFNYGNIHFIVLDSQESPRSSNGAMLNWMRDDLSANTLPWVVAYWHHPPYSKGSHDSDSESQLIDMRRNALPILEAAGVDLVLAGHSHSYERSFLIDSHYGNSGSFNTSVHAVDGGNGRPGGDGAYTKPDEIGASHEGAVYVVAGSSGQTSGVGNHRAMFASINRLGSMILEVNGKTMNATFLDNNGVDRDTFTITKEVGPPPAPTVTIVASDPTATEAGPTSGTFRISRTGATASSLTVRFNVQGSAISGSDFAPLGTSATIPVGQSSTTIDVDPIDDGNIEGDETVITTLVADPAYQVGGASSATVTIVSDDIVELPTVTMSVVDATATEAGPTSATFRFSRIRDPSAPLTVRLAVSGTATSGSDYASLGTSVTFPAGQSVTTVDVNPIDDPDVEVDETVVVRILPDAAAYQVGSPNSGTVRIISDDSGGVLPTVTLSVRRDTAREAGIVRGRYRIDRAGDSTEPLVVKYSVVGTATSGDDYVALPGSKTIKAGKNRAWFDIIPVDDTEVEGQETVEVTLAPDSAYQIGAANSGTVTIESDDTGGGSEPVVSLTVVRDTAREAGRTRGRFRVERTGPIGSPLTVRYAVGGSATSGDDYRTLAGIKVLKAGQRKNWFDIIPVNDTVAEGDETVDVTLSPDPAYRINGSSAGTVTIISNE